MTVGEWLADAERQLREQNVASARLDSQLLLEHCTDCSRAWLLAHPEKALAAAEQARADQLLARRKQRQPVSQLTGKREFAGLTLSVTTDVLAPRIETELIVELACRYAPTDSRLLDMGTGSGALAIAIKKQRPDLVVVASEISSAALAVAKHNAATHKVDIQFVQSDLWQALKHSPAPGAGPVSPSQRLTPSPPAGGSRGQMFQTVVTNLPYLSDQAMSELVAEARNEPTVALHGGTDGLDLYRRMLIELPQHLAPGGYLFTECDPWQQNDLIAAAARVGLQVIEQHYFILGFKRQPKPAQDYQTAV